MHGGILLLIATSRPQTCPEDNIAQLFVNILGASVLFTGPHSVLSWSPAATKANEKVDFANIRIYGLLTDLIDFHFYSYDPLTKEFAFDKRLVVNITREVAFTDMIPGMCLFLRT